MDSGERELNAGPHLGFCIMQLGPKLSHDLRSSIQLTRPAFSCALSAETETFFGLAMSHLTGSLHFFV